MSRVLALVLGIGCFVLAQRLNPPQSLVTVNSSAVGGGSAIFVQPDYQAWKKIVEIHLTNLTGTASYTFPVPFQFTPQVLSQSLANAVTALSTTSVTVTGSGSTGFIMLDGF